MDNQRRITNNTVISGKIGEQGSRDDYWFVAQMRDLQNRLIDWTYLMTSEAPNSNEVDLFSSFY